MKQLEFQRQRNELIRQYHVSIQPAWKKYNHRWKARNAFREAIKPHLEYLFNQIAKLKQRAEMR